MSTEMKHSGDAESKRNRPDYLTALKTAPGEPSQDGFGSAVFLGPGAQDQDLEEIARMY